MEEPTTAPVIAGVPVDLELEPTSNACSESIPQTALFGKLLQDQQQFYSSDSLLMLGSGFAAGSIVANTSLDGAIQRHFRTSVLGAESDEWYHTFHASKELGNGMYTLPVFASAWITAELFPDSELAATMGQWGGRSLRGFAVGAPPVIGLQLLTGGSRPYESPHGSLWKPFNDNNGVSGHSFMGSLPFITAAKMADTRTEKLLWYSASLLAPLSRANDNDHYPSQVALGWWMAYLAATAVEHSDNASQGWTISPYATKESTGLMTEVRF
ncbi:PAP2 superfamily protein [Aeoliella mucimassa]|uniref:PAP2 superfamily protein n=2 Tax=Aeoliella mucimassa TaxID=2527972 RepID=A0A518ARA0_9BACT|nr:PAP2 superfamily protein [Aeoliella mucimassa]